MVEALYMGCVPVLLKDHYIAPISDVLNWKKIAVEMTSKWYIIWRKFWCQYLKKKYIKMQKSGLK